MADAMSSSPLLRTRLRTDTLQSDVTEEVNEAGHYGNYYSGQPSPTVSDIPFNLSDTEPHISEQQRIRWDLNYHEAAIYLQEGENNDKFYAHPKSQSALPAYLITHNTWFYLLDTCAAVLLLSLALLEQPSMPHMSVPVAVHAPLELLGLLIIALELVMRMKWLGPKAYIKHKRTVIKTVTLIIMVAEAITVLVRQANHFRVTRAIRPLFLIDSYYCRNVRRFIRQMFQSLPPILDMLFLLLFFMLLFAIFGFHLFSPVPNDTYFQSFYDSFINLFILLTTANFPDVMMPAYHHSHWSAIFFVTYLTVELYLLMSLFLAVVYDAFSKNEKGKLKKLLLHQRTATQFAFKLLVSRKNPSKISLKHFSGLLKYYKKGLSKRDTYLLFKTMNVSEKGMLSLEEFHSIYESSRLKWKEKKDKELWSSDFIYPFNKGLAKLNRLVTWKWFEYFIYCVITANFMWILADTIKLSWSVDRSDWEKDESRLWWCSLLFIIVYIIEAIMKILGFGPVQYISSGWNIFDLLVTLLAICGLLMELINHSFYYIVVLRPLRLLRLFKLKKRYRDILGTLFVLINRMMGLAVVLLVVFYFFAIIGLELFSRYDMKNCCVNSSVENFYIYHPESNTYGYYYLNNFENILVAGVTLFELMVVNNWYVIMEGFVAVSNEWSRLYFIMFYLVTMVVLTIVVAFILESFQFRIEYRHTMSGHDIEDDTMARVEINLNLEERRMCNGDMPFSGNLIREAALNRHANEVNEDMQAESSHVDLIWYRGERRRHKTDFSLNMYKDEVQTWIDEQESRQRCMSAEMTEIVHEEPATIDETPVASLSLITAPQHNE